MSSVHALTLRISIANTVVSDLGSGAKLKFYTAGNSLLGTCVFGSVLGTVNSGTGKLTSSATTFTISGTGTPSYATLTTSADVVKITDTVGLSPQDFTVNTGTDVITAPLITFSNGDRVYFIGSSLPSPLLENKLYKVSNVSGSTFKVEDDCTTVDITTSGSGSMQVVGDYGVRVNTGSPSSPSVVFTTGQVVDLTYSYTPNP